MSTLVKIAIIFILSIFSLNAQDKALYTITVKVENTDSNDGKILIALYDNVSDFLDKSYKGIHSAISNNGCEVTFKNIPKGTYAVSIFHDENNNGKLDTNFIGIPKEDYGCSNNAKGFMGPPRWKNAKFQLQSDKIITIIL